MRILWTCLALGLLALPLAACGDDQAAEAACVCEKGKAGETRLVRRLQRRLRRWQEDEVQGLLRRHAGRTCLRGVREEEGRSVGPVRSVRRCATLPHREFGRMRRSLGGVSVRSVSAGVLFFGLLLPSGVTADDVTPVERKVRNHLRKAREALLAFDEGPAQTPIVARRKLMELLREHIGEGRTLARKCKAADLPGPIAEILSEWNKARRKIGNELPLATALASRGDGGAALEKLKQASAAYQVLCADTLQRLDEVAREASKPDAPPENANTDPDGEAAKPDGESGDPGPTGKSHSTALDPKALHGLSHRILDMEVNGPQLRVLMAPGAAPLPTQARLIDAGIVFRTLFPARPEITHIEIAWIEYMQNRFGERKHRPVAFYGLSRRIFKRMVWRNLSLEQQGALYRIVNEFLEGWQVLPPSSDPTLKDPGKPPPEFEIPKSVKPFFDFRKPYPTFAPGWKGNFRRSVDRALAWLAAHQHPDGYWSAAGFGSHCNGEPVPDVNRRPQGAGRPHYDPGVTGLALLAFLGAGHSDLSENEYGNVVHQGLSYLRSIQDPEGCYPPRNTQQYIYSHAIATLAMVEAYALSGNGLWHRSVQSALDFVALSRNPYFGWRYGIKPGDNDTSVTGWMVQALYAARRVNEAATARGDKPPFKIDMTAFDGVKAWLQKVTDPDYGKAGYLTRGSGSARPQHLLNRFPADETEAMTAAMMLSRVCVGEDPLTDELFEKGARLCLVKSPKWSAKTIDLYYWYYASTALAHGRYKHWMRWARDLEKALLPAQRDDTDLCQYLGSWDPAGPWGEDGGRVYSTAIAALALQAAWRYTTITEEGALSHSAKRSASASIDTNGMGTVGSNLSKRRHGCASAGCGRGTSTSASTGTRARSRRPASRERSFRLRRTWRRCLR